VISLPSVQPSVVVDEVIGIRLPKVVCLTLTQNVANDACGSDTVIGQSSLERALIIGPECFGP
jgi:hypothetical protein